MSISLEFKNLPFELTKLRKGEVSWWLGSTDFNRVFSSIRVIRRIWKKHLPEVDIRFLGRGQNHRILALPAGTSKKKRDAFLAELSARCQFVSDTLIID